MNLQRSVFFSFVFVFGLAFSLQAAEVRAVAQAADKTVDWADAYTDLQAAIEAAGENGTVLLRDGVYSISTTLTLTAAGQTLRGESRDGTILDGGKSVRILSANGKATPTFERLTFRNGNGGDWAGALYLPEGAGAFRVEDCTFADNLANQRGGAIYSAKNDNGFVTNCLFYGNSVTNTVNGQTQGGGAYFSSHADASVNKFTTLSDCVFSNNCAKGGGPWGGAVLFCHAGRIEGCTFVANVSENTSSGSGRGGSLSAGQHSRISSSLFTGASKAIYGIVARIESNCIVSNCAFRAVRPNGNYGIIHMGASLAVDCTFSDVSAGDMFFLENVTGGTIRNCLMTGCAGSGAFVCSHNSRGVRVEHCTFANNASGVNACRGSADYARQIFVNCVFQGAGPKVTGSGKYEVAVTNSIVPYVTGGTQDDGLIITADPGFKSQLHGDYRLASGSPAIDAGLDLGWQATAVDLDGKARFVGAASDLGCYERQAGEIDPFYGVRAVATAEEKTGDWADAYVGIQSAVDATSDGDTVLIKDGTYNLTAPVTILDKKLLLKGETRDGAVLDGQGASRCLDVKIQSGVAATVTFENLTLTNGFGGTSTAYENHYGAGGAAWLSCDSTTGRITLKNCRVTGSRTVLTSGANVDMGCGGGIFANHYCTLEKCLIDNNCASNSCGGGVRLVGIGSDYSQAGMIIVGCVISNNVSRGTGGGSGSGAHAGGVYAKGDALRLADTLFYGNEAKADSSSSYAGGLMLVAIKADVTNCQFVANKTANYGGAVEASTGNPSIIRDCSFTRNTGGYGVTYCTSSGVTYQRCAFTNNPSAVFYTTGSAPTFRNCLFADNTGVALNVFQWSGVLPAENCTIVRNGTGVSMGTGHADIINPRARLTNCIITDNGKDFVLAKNATNETSFTLTNCLVKDYPASHYAASDCVVGKSPRFVSAATGDYTLKAGSPCREKALVRDWMTAGAIDLGGMPRILGWYGQTRDVDPTALPDIGCYECPLERQGMLLLVR